MSHNNVNYLMPMNYKVYVTYIFTIHTHTYTHTKSMIYSIPLENLQSHERDNTYLGILISMKTMALESSTLKCIGTKMCCVDTLSFRASLQLSPNYGKQYMFIQHTYNLKNTLNLKSPLILCSHILPGMEKSSYI